MILPLLIAFAKRYLKWEVLKKVSYKELLSRPLFAEWFVGSRLHPGQPTGLRVLPQRTFLLHQLQKWSGCKNTTKKNKKKISGTNHRTKGDNSSDHWFQCLLNKLPLASFPGSVLPSCVRETEPGIYRVTLSGKPQGV